MKLNQKLAKKVLAVALTLAMVVTSLFVMPTTANAATGATIGRYVSVKAGTTNTTTIRNLGKNYYAKVSVTGTAKNGVTISRVNGNKVSATTKIQGTGSNIKLNVKNWNVPGKSYKLTIKTYNKSTGKLVRTYTAAATSIYKLTTKVTLDQTTLTLSTGDTATLTATKVPATSTQAITWSSSDTSVATVSKGVVTAVSTGTATITAKSGSKTVTCEVTVGKAKLVSTTATGAKKITLTFASTCTYAESDFTVKKGSASPSVSSVAIDGKTAVITLGSKMTEGTYTVTVGDNTGSVAVTDETLTSFVLSNTYLVEHYAIGDTINGNTATAASANVYYSGLNQYGEKMAVSAPTVTCSFGSTTATGNYYEDGNVTAATSSNSYVGTVTVTAIPSTLAIASTAGTIVLVDKTTGVSLSTAVSYAAKSTPTTLTVGGIYNTSTSKITDMVAGNSVSNYVVLMTVLDQYGNEYSASDLVSNSNITITPVSGLTNVTCDSTFANVYDITVSDVDYVALPLSAVSGSTAVAGSFYINIVNSLKGLLANSTFTVTESTVIKSLTVTADDTLYADKQNVLELTALDASGNEITSYDTLAGCELKMSSSDISDVIKLVKQSDGTAKIYYIPDDNSLTGTSSETRVLTFTANGTTTSNYLVKTLTIKVYAPKVATTVTGIKSTQTVAIANTTASLSLYRSYIIIEDQYQNAMSYSEQASTAISYTITHVSGGFATVTNGAITAGTSYASLARSYTTTGYDTLTITVNGTSYTTKLYTVDPEYATDLAIKCVNSGDVVSVLPDATTSGLGVSDIVVTGKVNGRTVVIPTSQYAISDETFAGITTSEGYTTKTGNIEITVDTTDGTNAISTVLNSDYEYSTTTPTLVYFEESGVTSFSTTDAAGTISATDFLGAFATYTQYGLDASACATGIKYSVVIESSTNTVKVSHNNTNALTITGTSGDTVVLYLTATFDDITILQELSYTIQ